MLIYNIRDSKSNVPIANINEYTIQLQYASEILKLNWKEKLNQYKLHCISTLRNPKDQQVTGEVVNDIYCLEI